MLAVDIFDALTTLLYECERSEETPIPNFGAVVTRMFVLRNSDIYEAHTDVVLLLTPHREFHM